MKRAFAFILLLIMLFSLVSCRTGGGESEIKYIFMFIGDGMGPGAVQLARCSAGAVNGKTEPEELSFTDFDTVGLFTNYDAQSFIPDSASSGTAMATGVKTNSESIATTASGKSVDSIATLLKKRLGMKIGIITTANLNHATPAVYYAHSSSRYDFYNIGKYIGRSGFDFFAGGELLSADGGDIDLITLAEQNGYKVSDSRDEIFNIKKNDKNLIISPDCDATGMIAFNIDREEGAISLGDYVDLAVSTLDNENGFFIMCEGARIDSAMHANDPATAVGEIKELSDAVDRALEFYKKHPEETLIIVTGDHETGGVSLGYTGTEYDTHFEKLSRQRLSYYAFDSEYVSDYRRNDTPFEEILDDIAVLFGLDDLTAYERQRIFDAWTATLSGVEDGSEEWHEYYTRTPLTAEVTRVVANRSGIGFSTYVHTASPMVLWAKGEGEEQFGGTYDNTDVYNKLYKLLLTK